MHASVAERLIIPAVLLLIFALLSGGFMFGVGGATPRMKIILRCSLLFMAGLLYSMAWHDKINALFRWDSAWIAVVLAIAVGCVLLCRRLLNHLEMDGNA